jgi:hypothetical protein
MNQPNPPPKKPFFKIPVGGGKREPLWEAEINARLREIIAGPTETITEELLKHLEVSLNLNP